MRYIGTSTIHTCDIQVHLHIKCGIQQRYTYLGHDVYIQVPFHGLCGIKVHFLRTCGMNTGTLN